MASSVPDSSHQKVAPAYEMSQRPTCIKKFTQGKRGNVLGNKHQITGEFGGVTQLTLGRLFDACWPRMSKNVASKSEVESSGKISLVIERNEAKFTWYHPVTEKSSRN